MPSLIARIWSVKSDGTILGVLLVLTCGTYAVHGPAAAQESLAHEASLVVVGTTGRPQSRWDETSKMIVTETVVDIDSVLKGDHKLSVVITTPGGVLPERNFGMIVPHMPQFTENEQVLLFLHTESGRTIVVGGEAGKFAIRRDKDGKSFVGANPLETMLQRVREAITPP